jgi:ribosomal-protein-serine acetyltransferase
VTIRIDELTELRILQLGDAEQVFELTDKNRAYLREWLPWVDSNQTVNDTRRFIQTIINQFKSNEGFQCGIWNEGKLTGVVGFHRIDWLNKNVEIGYWIAREYQGRGLITRSCKAMIEYAFREFNLKRVQIRCATGNIRSCAIPERLGFRKEGIMLQGEYLYGRFVDLVVYGMLDGDWKKLSPTISSRKGDYVIPANLNDVETIDGIVRALYECVTFEAGMKPDFARLRSLCHFNAQFVPPKESSGVSAGVFHTEEFIARLEKYIDRMDSDTKGFHEREAGRKTDVYGAVAHVFSAYELRSLESDRRVIGRGINSIQLLRDHDRWWILSVAWDSERPDNPIPRDFPLSSS